MLSAGELFIQNKGGIFLFELEHGKAMFKLLPFAEYRAYKHLLSISPRSKTDIEDEIWEKCILEHDFGTGLDDTIAGTVTTIANTVLWLSCPKNTEHANVALEGARTFLEDAIQQSILFICEAFPSYLPDIIEQMDWPMIARRLAQAELILGRYFEFKSPDSQPVDDSGKIFNRLDEMSADMDLEHIVNAKAVDFEKSNKQHHADDLSAPAGDFNLHNLRG